MGRSEGGSGVCILTSSPGDSSLWERLGNCFYYWCFLRSGLPISPRDCRYSQSPIPSCKCLSFLWGGSSAGIFLCESKKVRPAPWFPPGLPHPLCGQCANVFPHHYSLKPPDPYFELLIQNLHFWMSLRYLKLNSSETEPAVSPPQRLPCNISFSRAAKGTLVTIT